MSDYHQTINITLHNNKPMYRGKEVLLSTALLSKLQGKGENGQIQIYKRHLKYKNEK